MPEANLLTPNSSPAVATDERVDRCAPLVLHARVITGTGGGPDKTILNSPRYLNGHGYRCVCAFMHHLHDEGIAVVQKRAEEADAPFLSIPDRGPWDLGVVRRFVEFCRRENVAIWHAHDYKSNLLGLVVRQFHAMKLVTTVHGWVRFTRRTPLYYWIDRRCLPRYDAVICVSEDLKDICSEVGVPADRLHLIRNAIDTARFRRTESPIDAKRRLGFATDRTLIGAVGRLSPEKGFDVLVRAIDRLVRAGETVELVVVGDGDERKALEDQIAKTSHPGCFHLLGFRKDVADLFQAMDIFALSSVREGLPNVVLEAMAMETPVVATRVAGVPGLIRDGEDGLLVDCGEESQLSDALRTLSRDAAMRSQLARQARDMVERDYSFARRMERIRRVYETVLE